MKKITQIQGTASSLMVENISTDIISPSELYLKPRSAYADGLFAPWRYLADGSDDPDFVLNRPKHRQTKILLTGPNFGCGSSREIAVWCLQDYGIECVIGTSFGEIFFDNALKSGLLAFTMPEEALARLTEKIEASNSAECTVDLTACRITLASGEVFDFDMDPFRHRLYAEGLEEIDLILSCDRDIAAFQQTSRESAPWQLPVTSPASILPRPDKRV